MRKTAASMWIWDILGGCRTMNCSTTSRTGRPASGCWWISPGPVSRQAQRGEHGLRSDGLLTGDEPGVGVGHEGHTDVPQVDPGTAMCLPDAQIRWIKVPVAIPPPQHMVISANSPSILGSSWMAFVISPVPV